MMVDNHCPQRRGCTPAQNNSHCRRILVLALTVFALIATIAGPFFSLKSDAALSAPGLLTRPNSTRAIAVESVTQKAEPFPPVQTINFSAGGDPQTRVMLFASNFSLAAGESASVVSADAEDGAHVHYPLIVESVGGVPGFNWMTAVMVRLNDNLGDTGDVLVGITYHGLSSNRVRIGIGHIGGGPPDDPTPSPTPPSSATPDLGSGASLHGKQVFPRSEEHTSELQSYSDLVCRLLLEKKKERRDIRIQRLHQHEIA